MKQLKQLLKNYGIPILVLEAFLCYALIILHFAAIYWNPDWIQTGSFTVDETRITQVDASTVVPTGEHFVLMANVGSDILAVPMDLAGVERVDVVCTIQGPQEGAFSVDLYNADKKYDNAEQQSDFLLTGETQTLHCTLDPGGTHPQQAQLRFVTTATETNTTLSGITVTTYRRGSLFVARQMPSLVLGLALGVLFVLSLISWRKMRQEASGSN